MTETVALQQNNVYGAFELKKVYPRNYAIGVGLAIFLHLLLIGSYWFTQVLSKEDESGTPTVRMKINYSDLGPPPSIENVAPQIQVAGPVAAPTVGVPVPVPDEEAPPEQVIASQTELSAQQAPALSEDLTGGGAQITQDIKIEEDKPKDEDPDMNAFVAVEKLPEMVFAAKPEYPEIAKRAGITGKVFVKVLIDKEGRPKKAVVIKSDSELFNQAAIDAAMKSAFSPALQNQHPISVWIVLPYRFALEGQN
ncbi:MAG: energy transducer TonB [Stygiobacter sp.]|uniref:Energy transducer TonB n=1 Tax=Stygiobacter electus TaxID=3032292 RepID=A0AAE3TD35_9BACT|nr:energy transducer TonB [Stygiobacter electus]MDF1613018.1 energy transducer TonB [Stygiobacter electus]